MRIGVPANSRVTSAGRCEEADFTALSAGLFPFSDTKAELSAGK